MKKKDFINKVKKNNSVEFERFLSECQRIIYSNYAFFIEIQMELNKKLGMKMSKNPN